MKHSSLFLILAFAAAPACLLAQSVQSASNEPQQPSPSPIDQYAITAASPHTWTPPNYSPSPFSRIAVGGGVSSMGVNMQVAVIANRYMNVRGVGNYFTYSLNNINVNGLNVSGTANFASGGASVDFYPFPNHGFRVSPGVMFYNQNRIGATVVAPGGTSFTLNNYTYYSSQSNPVTGVAGVGLNTQNPAFTMTTGWGNMIPRHGNHLSFPVEVGAAFIGSPSMNMALTSGQVCQDPAGTIGCVNVVGNPQIQSNVQAQQQKYQNDINPFRFYPIFSAGVAYSFGLRSAGESGPAARPMAGGTQ
jgi:hypothetical protein